MKATFWGLDDDGEDVKIGTLTLADGKVTAEPAGHRTLDEIAEEVQDGPNVEESFRNLPRTYNNAYLRASIEVKKGE